MIGCCTERRKAKNSDSVSKGDGEHDVLESNVLRF